MASVPEVTIESLQAKLLEKDESIKSIKEKAKAFVEKLRADHTDAAEALKLEQAAKQQLQDKLESIKPFVLNLREEKAAAIKELETLKEESKNAETRFNTNLLEAQKEHDSVLKIQQDALNIELNAAKSTAGNKSVEKDQLAKSEMTVRSLEEQLALARAESLTIEERNKNSEITISKLSADLHTLEINSENEKKELSEKSAGAVQQLILLEESNSSLTVNMRELSYQLQLRSTELSVIQNQSTDLQSSVDQLTTDLLSAREAIAAKAKEGQENHENQLKSALVEGDKMKHSMDAAAEAELKDLRRTVTGLQQSLEALASQLALSKANEETAVSTMKDIIVEKDYIAASVRTLASDLEAAREQDDDIVSMAEMTSADTAEKLRAQREELDTLLKELEVLRSQQVENEGRLAEQAAQHTVEVTATREATQQDAHEQASQLKAQLEQQALESTVISASTAAKIESDEKIKALTAQIEVLKSHLLESEGRLKDTEEAAWHAKAEAAELLYALEQEQSSVKKMSEELINMRDVNSELLSDHSKAIESVEMRSQVDLKNILHESEESKNILQEPEESISSMRTQMEGLMASLSRAEAELLDRNGELDAAQARLLEAETMGELNVQLTAACTAHTERISKLEGELSAEREEREEGRVREGVTAGSTSELHMEELEDLKGMLSKMEQELTAVKESKESAVREKDLEKGLAVKELEDQLSGALEEPAAVMDQQKETERKDEEIAEVVKTLERQLEAARGKLEEQQQQLAQQIASVSGSRDAHTALQGDVSSLTAELESAKEEGVTLRGELVVLKGQLDGAIKESESSLESLESITSASNTHTAEIAHLEGILEATRGQLEAMRVKETHLEELLIEARQREVSLRGEIASGIESGIASGTAADAAREAQLEELKGTLSKVEEELAVAREERESAVKAKEHSVRELKELEVAMEMAKGQYEQDTLERQAATDSLIAAAAKHSAALSDLSAQYADAIATEEAGMQDKMESAKKMFLQLKEGHAAKEEELTGAIRGLEGSIAVLNAEKEELSHLHSSDILKLKEELVKRIEEGVQEGVLAVKALEEELEVSRGQLEEEKARALQQLETHASQIAAGALGSTDAHTALQGVVSSLTAELDASKEEAATVRGELVVLKGQLDETAESWRRIEGTSQSQQEEIDAMEAKILSTAEEIRALQVMISNKIEEHTTEVEENNAAHAEAVDELLETHAAILAEIEQKLSDRTTILKNTQEQLQIMTVTKNDIENNLNNTILKLNSDIQKLENSVSGKKSDLDATKANLAATTTAYSALSAQHNQLKIKSDHLTQQLEAEVNQTAERKLKVRAYVDNLNSDKREMELVRVGLMEQLSASGSKISILESQIQAEELKLKKEEVRFNTARQAAIVELEQQQQEHSLKIEAQEGMLSLQVEETNRLQGLLDEHARATAEEVQEAYRQMEVSGKELESHKAKRLVARNEMIGAAQALERSQSEGQALRAYIQYKLAPIVFEQVAALEMLLSAIEHFRQQIATKGNVRMHDQVSEYLSRRLQSGLSPPSPNYSPESSTSSTNSNTVLTLRNNGTMKSGEESELKGVFLASASSANRGMETGVVRANSPPIGPLGSDSRSGPGSGLGSGSSARAVHYNPYPNNNNGNNQVTILGEAMEQAEILRKELNRVHAGLSLLSHSVDRLGDVVTVNSKCCGGVFQMFSESVTGSIEGSIRGSIVGRTLVSHNNTSSSSRRPDAVGLSGMISSGVGYTTVNGDDSLSGSSSNMYKGNKGGNSNGSNGSINGNGALQDNKKKDNKINTTKNAIFSILPDEDDDDGEELEII